MILQIEEQGELREEVIRVSYWGDLATTLEVDRHGFSVRYLKDEPVGVFRSWGHWKRLYEYVKKHYPEALL